MMRLLSIIFVLSAAVNAADYKLGKVVEIHDASSLAESAVSNHPVSAQGGGGATASIPSQFFAARLPLPWMEPAIPPSSARTSTFKITDFNTGDPIQARIEGKKLVIKRLDGKEMKSKIIRQEPIEAAGPK